VQEGAREREALLHAAREALHGALSPGLDLHLGEHGADTRLGVADAVELRVESEILRGGQFAIEKATVAQPADPAAERRRRALLPEDPQATRRRLQQRGEQLDERRFAGPVRPEDREAFAGTDLEVEVDERA
jgi:hypothetical protein